MPDSVSLLFKITIKAFYLLINQDLKIIKTVFMPGQRKGKKVYGEQEGKRGKKENLVAWRRKKEKNLMAPIIFNWMNEDNKKLSLVFFE